MVVDWRSGVIAEGELAAPRPEGRLGGVCDAWRAGYGPSMNRVRTGELPWTKLDDPSDDLDGLSSNSRSKASARTRRNISTRSGIASKGGRIRRRG
jgi:hypothetical protein